MFPVSPRNSESYLIPSAKSLSVLDSQDGLYCPQQKPQPKDNIILRISQLIKACAEMFMNNEVYERGWKDFPKEREKAEILLREPQEHTNWRTTFYSDGTANLAAFYHKGMILLEHVGKLQILA